MAQHDDKEALRLKKELEKYEALDQADIDGFISFALADKKGQKFIWWLMQIGKYGVNPFSPDPTTMAFQAGEMNIGSQILARIIEVNPLGFAELQLARKLEDDRRSSSARAIAAGDDLLSRADPDSDSDS